MLQNLSVDPEFASKIPSLREEELKQLEENILADGVVINPLIVWNGIIVDGHNRYRILQQHPEIQFTIYEKEFTDRYAVIAWICKNQLGRRNLTPQQFKYLMGQQYGAEKASHGGDRKSDQQKSSGQNDHLIEKEKTRQRIANENHVSESFVQRSEYFAQGVDAAEEAVPGIKQEILTGSIKPTEKAVAAIAKAPQEERPALVQQLRQTKEPEKPEEKHKDKEKPQEKPQEKPKRKRSVAETLQAIREVSEKMLQPTGEMNEEDIFAEMEDALDTLIFRWNTCLQNNPTLCLSGLEGIRRISEQGMDFIKNFEQSVRKANAG